jgi:hypothetical protein
MGKYWLLYVFRKFLSSFKDTMEISPDEWRRLGYNWKDNIARNSIILA